MKDVMILKDGTTIELEEAASMSALRVLSADKIAMVATWDKLTENNLEAVQVKNGAGLVVGNYTALMLVSEMSVVQEDGSILTSYNLREKTTVEKRLDSVEAGQEIQDGAINDLGTAVGEIAEREVA